MMKGAVLVAVALALATYASAGTVALTAGGPAVFGHTNKTYTFTFTITATAQTNFQNYWLWAQIAPPTPTGDNTTDANLPVAPFDNNPNGTYFAGLYITVSGANSGLTQILRAANTTVNSTGVCTGGQVVVSLDPRTLRQITAGTTITFTVQRYGFNATAYWVRLLTDARSVSELNNDVGTNKYGKSFVNTVPCCGAKFSVAANMIAHDANHLQANVTATNGTLYQATLRGVQSYDHTAYFDAVTGLGSVYVSTCHLDNVCRLYVQAYYTEVQSGLCQPLSSQFAAQFMLTPADLPNATSSSSSGSYTGNGDGSSAAAPSLLPAVALASIVLTVAWFSSKRV